MAAWQHFNRLWVPETGLARATPGYDKLTPWDIGSVLAALHSARVLELIPDAEYRDRVALTLATLERLPLFRDAVFNRMYSARTGRMIGRGEVVSTRGYAWSATDIGRLLIWLHIIARADTGASTADGRGGEHGQLAAAAARVVQRLDLDRIVSNGYMHGEEITARGRTRRFQEGRVGYEQYAARGFALWGADVSNALSLRRNAEPIEIMGHGLLRDTRGLDRITSEPFVLIGLELGWTAEEEELARNVLAVQETRFRRTGIVTIVNEDALAVAPHYFYYYCVYCSGKTFVIETVVPGRSRSSPRWVSTKAAFGWHALLPGEYTRIAVERVAAARTEMGISSGVFESSGKPTGAYDVNTAAVVLEAAAYHRLGRPLSPAMIPQPTRK